MAYWGLTRPPSGS